MFSLLHWPVLRFRFAPYAHVATHEKMSGAKINNKKLILIQFGTNRSVWEAPAVGRLADVHETSVCSKAQRSLGERSARMHGGEGHAVRFPRTQTKHEFK